MNSTLLCSPHIWHDFACARVRAGDAIGARRILERGIEALPQSALLAFSLAHQLELAGDGAGARATLDAHVERAPSPLAFVHAMHVTRRSQSLDAARRVLLRARKSPAAGWQPYVAAALVEWHHAHNVDVARNIFEFGMKEYAHEARFVAHYVDMLVRLVCEC